jgi:hypothetical protein
MTPKSLLALSCCTLLAACAGAPVATTAPAATRPEVLDHVPVVRMADGHEAVLIRGYEDEIKNEDGSEQRVDVRYFWDYTAASAREVHTAIGSGEVVFDRLQPDNIMLTTPAELAFAYVVLRRDPAIDAKFTDDTKPYGGFAFREPGHPICAEHSRCIHVIASRDYGRERIAHAIVDLQTARIADPDYHPALGGPATTPAPE